MAQFFSIHPTHPQARLVRRAADIVRAGGLLAYPTDSCYALGCRLGEAKALARLRRVRGVDERHHLTLMCRDLSEIANYALLAELNEPMLSATLSLPGEALPLSEPREIRHRLERELDLVIDAGPCGVEPSTVIDLTGDAPSVLRKGKGSLAPFAVEPV